MTVLQCLSEFIYNYVLYLLRMGHDMGLLCCFCCSVVSCKHFCLVRNVTLQILNLFLCLWLHICGWNLSLIWLLWFVERTTWRRLGMIKHNLNLDLHYCEVLVPVRWDFVAVKEYQLLKDINATIAVNFFKFLYLSRIIWCLI